MSAMLLSRVSQIAHLPNPDRAADKNVYRRRTPLDVGINVDAYMKDQRTAGSVIIQDGKINLEKYGLGFSGDGRWTSFSVAKSITSTLVGAAIKDGYIKNIGDKVSDYIPDLKGSVYDDVTISGGDHDIGRQKWNGDYADPNRTSHCSTRTRRAGH